MWLAGGCASWYLDPQGRNTTLWPDYAYRFAGARERFEPAEHEFRRERRGHLTAPVPPPPARVAAGA